MLEKGDKTIVGTVAWVETLLGDHAFTMGTTDADTWMALKWAWAMQHAAEHTATIGIYEQGSDYVFFDNCGHYILLDNVEILYKADLKAIFGRSSGMTFQEEKHKALIRSIVQRCADKSLGGFDEW